MSSLLCFLRFLLLFLKISYSIGKELHGLDPLDFEILKSSLEIPSWFDTDAFKNHFQHVVEELDEDDVDEVKLAMLKEFSL